MTVSSECLFLYFLRKHTVQKKLSLYFQECWTHVFTGVTDRGRYNFISYLSPAFTNGHHGNLNLQNSPWGWFWRFKFVKILWIHWTLLVMVMAERLRAYYLKLYIVAFALWWDWMYIYNSLFKTLYRLNHTKKGYNCCSKTGSSWTKCQKVTMFMPSCKSWHKCIFFKHQLWPFL